MWGDAAECCCRCWWTRGRESRSRKGEKNKKGEVTRGGGKGEGLEGACKRRGIVEGSRERKGEGSGEGLVDG